MGTARHQMAFLESAVMARLQDLARRLRKLVDLFDTIQSFNVISVATIDGIDGIVERFQTLVGRFRARTYDPLDWTNEVLCDVLLSCSR